MKKQEAAYECWVDVAPKLEENTFSHLNLIAEIELKKLLNDYAKLYVEYYLTKKEFKKLKR